VKIHETTGASGSKGERLRESFAKDDAEAAHCSSPEPMRGEAKNDAAPLPGHIGGGANVSAVNPFGPRTATWTLGNGSSGFGRYNDRVSGESNSGNDQPMGKRERHRAEHDAHPTIGDELLRDGISF
jgi:hypothetical protein